MLQLNSLDDTEESYKIVQLFLKENDTNNPEYEEALVLTLEEIDSQLKSDYSKLYSVLMKTKWMLNQFEFAELQSIGGRLVSDKHKKQSMLVAKAYGLIWDKLNKLNNTKYWK
jgi:hypothetical protein